MACKETNAFILYSLKAGLPGSKPEKHERFENLRDAWPFAIELLQASDHGTHVYVKLPNGFEFSPVPEGGWTGRMSAVA